VELHYIAVVAAVEAVADTAQVVVGYIQEQAEEAAVAAYNSAAATVSGT
jgi:hypothetical protein